MKFKTALLALCLTSATVFAKTNNKPKEQVQKTETEQQANVDPAKLSLAIGHLLSKTINNIGISFDLDLIIQGLKDAANGVVSPLTENDCVAAITQEQKKNFEALATKNLSEAETFLKQEAKKKEFKSLEGGKVIYKVLSEGNGDSVKDTGKLAFKYKGSLLSGDVFGESAKEETMDISHLVSGLKAALVGMKEGEKRLIHIHPEKGYGTEGMLPPNSLLSFEIEVAKATIEEAPVQEVAPLQETALDQE